MAIIKRNEQTQHTLSRLRSEMDDLLGRFFPESDWLSSTSSMGWPVMDVSEQDEAFVVHAELPGLKAEDIELTVEGNRLTLRGEKKETREESTGGYQRTERRFGQFHRDVSLPCGVDPDRVEANFHDGILTITLPKTETAKARHIDVKAA